MTAPPPPPFPDAAASDPVRLGWMQGSPPPPEKTIAFADGSLWAFPRTRWAFSHMRELLPTVNVSRGDGPVAVLPRGERDDLDGVAFATLDGWPMRWGDSLAANYTDGIVVLHRGAIVQERYFGALQPQLAHSAMSVTKPFVGTMAAMLAHGGLLDPAVQVTHYLPELAGTAYADATLRQVMDMTIGVKYSEAYADPAADIWHDVRASYTTMPGWSYRHMWWVTHDDHGAFTARGIHGQAIWVDPKAEMVIARYASHRWRRTRRTSTRPRCRPTGRSASTCCAIPEAPRS